MENTPIFNHNNKKDRHVKFGGEKKTPQSQEKNLVVFTTVALQWCEGEEVREKIQTISNDRFFGRGKHNRSAKKKKGVNNWEGEEKKK